MSSFIRAALRSNADDNTTIIMDGPLSEVFTKALNLAYAKKDPVTGEPMDGATPQNKNAETDKQIRAITQESQQLDEHAMAGAISVNKELNAVPSNEVRVYAVDEDEVQNEDIVRFARMAVAVKVPSSLVLIAQKAQNQSTDSDNEHVNKMLDATDKSQVANAKANALKSLASSFNVKSYSSLEAFQNDFFN